MSRLGATSQVESRKLIRLDHNNRVTSTGLFMTAGTASSSQAIDLTT